MRKWRWLLIVLTLLLLWSGSAFADVARSDDATLMTSVELTGGVYRLTQVSWSAPVVTSGGNYAILSPEGVSTEAPAQSSGCCCVYAPYLCR